MAGRSDGLSGREKGTRRKEETHVSISARLQRSPSCRRTKFDSESGYPMASPLNTLEAVLSWRPREDELNVASVPLRREPSKCVDDPSVPKLIVCHDMMGGYHKDRFTQGHRSMEDYNLYHWQHISAFIYFSHHFVSIPPSTWTNAAHRHGTLSLGTVITEWKEGAKLCHQLLSDESTLIQFAQQLVALAQYYGFDGWLINIENPINPQQMGNLYTFLSLLSTGIHEAIPGSKVIWYDSVTVEGHLKWQNSLNQQNEPFFSLCDGIFLNYGWNESALRFSSAMAGGRSGEVYVGIDVFGRGCFGGGGYNSCAAMEVIQRHGLSAALFAPGWVYETQDKSHFFDHQDRFWSLLAPHCPLSSYGLPIVSSFGRGCGHQVCIDGKLVLKESWTNLSAQDLQPSFTTHGITNDAHNNVIIHSVTMDTDLAYNNGASLKVQGSVRNGSKCPALVRLLKTDFVLQNSLLVAFTYSTTGTAHVTPFLQLTINGSVKAILLNPAATPPDDSSSQDVVTGCGLSKSCLLPRPPWCSPTHQLLGPLPPSCSSGLEEMFTGGEGGESEDGWKTCFFLIAHNEFFGYTVEEVDIAVGCQDGAGDFAVSVGEIKLLEPSWLSPTSRPSSIRRLRCQDAHCSNGLSFTLTWLTVNNPADPIDHCNIYSTCVIGNQGDELPVWQTEAVFLGRAYTECFHVAGLPLFTPDLGSSAVSYEIRAQPVSVSRRKSSVVNSPCLVVHLTK